MKVSEHENNSVTISFNYFYAITSYSNWNKKFFCLIITIYSVK